MVSQLDFLRKYSSVDCDTLDFYVVKELGPFDDCTSNQAIAYFELIKEENKELIWQAAQLASSHDIDDTKRIAYSVKVMMVLLSLRVLPYLTGRVHTQSSMYTVYDTDATVRGALEIIDIYKRISPSTPVDRICIKIPATYEGLEACRILEAQGVRTLATTLFTIEQAILASEVGCHYVSPYVNELKVHFIPGAVDRNKGFHVVKEIFEYYEKYEITTRLLSASLVSTDEALRLSGSHHITIPPVILSDLARNTMQIETFPTLNAEDARRSNVPKRTFLGKEQLFKEALRANSEVSRKLEEAIEWFLKFEKDMEAIMGDALQTLVSSS